MLSRGGRSTAVGAWPGSRCRSRDVLVVTLSCPVVAATTGVQPIPGRACLRGGGRVSDRGHLGRSVRERHEAQRRRRQRGDVAGGKALHGQAPGSGAPSARRHPATGCPGGLHRRTVPPLNTHHRGARHPGRPVATRNGLLLTAACTDEGSGSSRRSWPVSGLARFDRPPSHGHPTVARWPVRTRLPLRGQHRLHGRPPGRPLTGFPFNPALEKGEAPGTRGQYIRGLPGAPLASPGSRAGGVRGRAALTHGRRLPIVAAWISTSRALKTASRS